MCCIEIITFAGGATLMNFQLKTRQHLLLYGHRPYAPTASCDKKL